MSRKAGDRSLALPTISVSALRSGDPAGSAAVAEAIGQAARRVGFFRICDHGIDPILIEAVHDVASRFFHLPDASEQRYYIGLSRNHR